MKQQLLETLGLAEIYLLDGAPITALQQVREAMRIVTLEIRVLAESEDLGDVSDHLLQQVSL
jgi:hypothetical protein